ncbi:MAG: ABC transporter permease [Proteobacteria bacterium]|nr:ABC transporter permease [Pseudomonadota bacterium]
MTAGTEKLKIDGKRSGKRGSEHVVHAGRPKNSRLTAITKSVAIKIAQIVIGLLVWHVCVTLLDVDSRIVPAPLEVLESLWAQIVSGWIFGAMWLTMQETLIGFLIGSVLGIAIAVVLSEFRLARIIFEPYIVALQAVPKVAVAPLFLIWFGFGIESKIALVVSIMFFPVLINTMAGLMSVDEEMMELMRAYRATRWQTLWRLKAYIALPYVFASFEVSLVLSLIAAVIAEMLGSGTTIGLGTLIRIFESRVDTAGIFAVLIVLSLLGVALHAAVLMARKRLLSWQNTAATRN